MISSIKKGLLDNEVLLRCQAIHLAIVNEPYLTYIKDGRKTIETRFTLNKIAPYEQIKEGDIVCMKAAGKPIDSFFIAGNTEFFVKNDDNFSNIRKLYSKEICAEDDFFWDIRKDKKFISLIHVKNTFILKNSFEIPKKDKRAWIRFDNSGYENIILVAGKIGSGKTYWSDKIAEEYNCDRASFSSYIKHLCKKEGLDITRSNLQDIGRNVVKNDLDKYIYYTLNYSNSRYKNIVIDGLRSVDVAKRVKELYINSRVTMIYINCTEEQRKINLKNRGENTTTADTDSMELEVINLAEISDYLLSFSKNSKEELHKIKSLFSTQTMLDIF